MATAREIQDQIASGIGHCKKGRWEEGLAELAPLTQQENLPVDLPGTFYSYLGYAIAKVQGRRREGLALCQHGVKLEFYRGENYINLAGVHLLVGNRAGAVKAIFDGLQHDRRNRELQRMARKMGIRRRPIIPFLDRAHPINVWLGKVRHRLLGGI